MAVGLLMCVEVSALIVVADASIRVWDVFLCQSADVTTLCDVVVRFCTIPTLFKLEIKLCFHLLLGCGS